MHLGILAAWEDREAEAIEWFQSGIAARPDHIDTRFNYAITLANFERWNEAARELELILEADPAHAQARAVLARVQNQEGMR